MLAAYAEVARRAVKAAAVKRILIDVRLIGLCEGGVVLELLFTGCFEASVEDMVSEKEDFAGHGGI
jgi:hypothetical protein